MTRNRKIAVGIGILAIIVAAAGMSIRAGRNKVEEVKIQSVSRKDLVSVVTASGWIRPHRKVDVQSDVMGRIIELRVKEGDVVRRGEVLLRIDSLQLAAGVARSRAGVSQALAQAAQAKASMIQTQRAYQRARDIAAQNKSLMSEQQLEDAQASAQTQAEMSKAADYNVDVARAALKEAEDQLSKTVIRAPMNGVVTRLNVDEGETAIVGMMNNPGSLLLTVSDLSDMEAVIKVDETDVPQIHLGDSASVSIDAFPKQTFTGRVTEISHSAIVSPENASTSGTTQQAVDFEVVVKLDHPPANLRPDLSATADVVTATRKDALAVPIIALTVRERGNVKPLASETPAAQAAADSAVQDRSKDEEGVFVVKQGKAQFVPVTVGIAGREDFEVLNGLSEGDSVVAGPYEAIRGLENGKAVRAAPAAKDQAANAEGTT